MPDSFVEQAAEQSVAVRRTGDCLVLGLAGELDLFAMLSRGPLIDRALTPCPPRIVVDLRAVTFVDCGGLALLLRVRGKVAGWGGEFAIHCPDRRTLRLLRYVALPEPLTFVAALPEG